MSEPDRHKRISTGVRFSSELHDRLIEAAKERGLSASFLVNRAVEDFLDRLLPADEIQWTRLIKRTDD